MIHLRPFWVIISTTKTHSTTQGWSWPARRQQLGGLVSWHWVSGSILVCPWYLPSPLTLWLPLLTPWALQGPGKPDACGKDGVGGSWRGVKKGRTRAPLLGAVTGVNSWQQSGTYSARCDTMNVDKTGCWCVHLHTDVHTLPSRSTRWAWREGPGHSESIAQSRQRGCQTSPQGEVAFCVWKKNLRKRDGINTNKAQDSVQSRFLIASVGNVTSPSPVTLGAGDQKARRKR